MHHMWFTAIKKYYSQTPARTPIEHDFPGRFAMVDMIEIAGFWGSKKGYSWKFKTGSRNWGDEL
jgi:hypothetical protein